MSPDLLFWDSLPAEYQEFFQLIYQEKITTTLVGGAAREFWQKKTVATDLDCELTTNVLISDKEWRTFWTTLVELIPHRFPHWKVQFLNDFLVLKISTTHGNLELTSPRIETYNQEADHKNFSSQFISNLDFAHASLRRDFTLNSFGLSFSNHNQDWVDPHFGRQDLRDKVLRPTSENFWRDPVRFLRFVRFAQTLQCTPSAELVIQLKKMNLQKISWHYLWSEAQKSKNVFVFFKNLQMALEEFTPQGLEDLIFFNQQFQDYKLEVLEQLPGTPTVEEFILALGLLSQRKPAAQSIGKLPFQLSDITFDKGVTLAKTFHLLYAKNFKQFHHELKSHDFNWAKNSESFQSIWKLYQILTSGHLIKMIWPYLTVIDTNTAAHLQTLLPLQNYLGREDFIAFQQTNPDKLDLAPYRLWAHLKCVD